MLRRLIRHPRTQAAIAALLGSYLALVSRTTRWTMVGEAHVNAILGESGPPGGVIVGFWHERLAILPLAWHHYSQRMPVLAGARVHVLVSQHRDGRLIGEIARRFSIAMVYGSTSRGGGEGLLALARLITAGEHVAITPDGPRGPRRKAAAGIAHLAALTGAPVVAIGTSTSRARLLGSWDRMMLPLPFGRGVIAVRAPIQVPPDGGEAALAAIEAALSAACDEADLVARGGTAAPGPPEVAA
jgi:lysophospholipid acyltransferase (LPLAT)-like uncharacterized protein